MARPADHRILIPVPGAEQVWLFRVVCDPCAFAIAAKLQEQKEQRPIHTRPFDGEADCFLYLRQEQDADAA